ncbi:MAG: type 1 periplasmic binding fold superfamily protein [Flavobacteriaceae bacterium]
MKNLKILSILFTLSVLVYSCSDDDSPPAPVDEEEVITTMTVTLTPQGGGTAITLQSRDLDGDGPNAPDITVSGNLSANTTYDGSIELLNETESPAEDVTEEIEAEDEEHQFFFSVSGSLATTGYSDQDADGNPVGLQFTLVTGAAGSGALGVTLRHEPKKPNDGTLTDAGGETDITQTFNVTVE